jgi:hypothetical protein
MIRKYDEFGNPLDSDSDLVNSYLKDKYFTGDLSDNSLQAERQTADDRRLAAGLGQGADTIAAALSGAKPQTAFYDKMAANADRGVKDIESRRKSKMDEARFAQEAQKFGMEETKFAKEQRLQDPDSPESRVYQSALRGLPNSPFTEDQLSHVTAADKDRVTSVAQLIELAESRKEQTAARLQQQKMLMDEKHAKLETPIGRAQNEKDANDIKSEIDTYNKLKQGIQKLQTLREGMGVKEKLANKIPFVETRDYGDYKSTANQLQTEYKKLMSLRGLGEPTQKFLDQIIPSNPSEIDIGGGTEAKMKSFSDSLDRDLEGKASSRGLNASPVTAKYRQAPEGPKKPKMVTQNGHTYTLNEMTGEYE